MIGIGTTGAERAVRAAAILGACVFVAACGSEQRKIQPSSPTEPRIQSLESTSETVHPGDSVQLAVVAGPASELDDSGSSDAGSTSTGSQALSHDAGTAKDTAHATRDVGADDAGTEAEMDAALVSDAGSSSDAQDRSGDDATSVSTDAGSGLDSDAGGSRNDASSGSTPEPPSGNVPEGWSVEWSATGDGWSITGDGPMATLTAPDRYEATATVTVTVSTPKGRSTSAETTVTTGSNTAPAIVNSTTRPNPVAPSGTVEATIEAADPNGDELIYQWRIADPWEIESTSGGEATIRAPDRDGVFADLRVEVRDGYDGRTSSSIRLETQTNTPPNLASVTASPPQVAPEGTIQLEASATDVEDDQLDYAWSVPSDWSAGATEGASIEVTAPDQYGATATVRVTIEDSRGVTATGSVVVSTESNRGPSIASLDANPKSVSKGGTIDFEVTASDPNGDPLSYNWSVQSSQNWSLSSQGSGATLQAPDQPGESTNVEVTVTDESGASARASMVVSTEANRAPTIASVSATSQTLQPGDTVQVRTSATDIDGDALSYNWSASGNWSVSGSGNAVQVTAPQAYGSNGTISVTVSDGFNGEARGRLTLSTENNRDPELSALTANPQTMAPSSQTSIEAIASDPNGDALSYSWQVPQGWSKSGSGDTISLTAPGSYGKRGLVRVTISDGHGGDTQGAVLVETDRNQSPIVSSLTANPLVVSPGGSSTIRVSASDPNGDSLSYAWQVPSGWTQTGSGDQIEVVAPNQTSQSATITVTVSDGQRGSSQSAVVLQTINNRPPTIGRLSASPDPVLQNAETTVDVEASDPDGDTLSYQWAIANGEWSRSGNGDEITLEAPNKASSSTSVQVTVGDGRGETITSTITVQTKGCPSNRGNCDGNAGNGCEVNLNDDENNCSACGQVCSGRNQCVQGQCKNVRTPFLVNEIDQSNQRIWKAGANNVGRQIHQIRANDVDCYAAQGSSKYWFVDHYDDHFGRFGQSPGIEREFGTPYAYPKHVTVFSNHVFVMGRNDATIYKYDFNGNLVTRTSTSNRSGQGMATDGQELFVSFWDGGQSHFEVYDASLNRKRRVSNPSGLSRDNVFDIVYDPVRDHFFGLATNGEGGTNTSSKRIVEFTMGGSVIRTHDLSIQMDGMGQKECN